jgi:hypothetical protein
MSIYKEGLRQGLRFEYKGLLSIEQLMRDLSLEELDGIFQRLNAQKKLRSEESLLASKTAESTELDLKIEIVKDIVATLLQEQADRKEAASKSAQKQKLLEVINRKRDSQLENMPLEDLERMIAEM